MFPLPLRSVVARGMERHGWDGHFLTCSDAIEVAFSLQRLLAAESLCGGLVAVILTRPNGLSGVGVHSGGAAVPLRQPHLPALRRPTSKLQGEAF